LPTKAGLRNKKTFGGFSKMKAPRHLQKIGIVSKL
jgi:hypothetical protein